MHNNFPLIFLLARMVNEPSPSVNPVSNQGFKLRLEFILSPGSLGLFVEIKACE